MTENKRFTVGLRRNTTQYEIIDNKTGHFPFLEPFYYEKSAKDLAKFLNELHEENNQLRFDFKEMKELLCTLEDEIEKLERENKELKGKASSWKITASEEISEKSELLKQIVELKHKLQQQTLEYATTSHRLAEENQHIKDTIKQAYNNERTQLGRNVLKQLLEQIQ